jgi:Tfp pilus tip-associated adhesin PilY1
MGGRPIEAAAANGPQGDHYFSEIFAFDVTDPESEPKLLWRYSTLELGLSLGVPAVVRSDGKFYVVLASGPVTDEPKVEKGKPQVKYGKYNPQDGYSNQRARLIVLDVKTGVEVVNTNPKAGGNQNFLVAPENNSFFNEPFVPVAQIRAPDWNNHAIYYGLTVSRDMSTGLDRGAIYRLRMVNDQGKPLPVNEWKLTRFYNTDRPVSAAVNSAYDRHGQLWVFFGTGRLWSFQDLSPCLSTNTKECRDNHGQYIFGLKEPLSPKGLMTFADRSSESHKLLDLSGAIVVDGGVVKNIINQPNLLKTSWMQADYAAVRSATEGPNTIGYKRKLEIGKTLSPKSYQPFEMLLTQPKLVSQGEGESLMAFTTFEPSGETCGAFGLGYQYAVDAFTGLPNPRIKGSFGNVNNPEVPKEVVTGAVSMGDGRPTETVILSFDNKFIIRASSSEGSVFDIEIDNPGSDVSGGHISWREVLDMGIEIPKEVMTKDIP